MISAIASLLVLSATCTGDPQRPHAFVRDSAGVRIVESRNPAVPQGDWHLAVEPRISIGVVQGNPEYQFTQIQNVGHLPNGGYFVAQLSNPPQVRVYDANGKHVRSIGRAGQGPGELAGIAWADRMADTIRVFDFWASRITYFGTDGRVLREIPITTLAGRPVRAISASPGFSNGDILARSNYLVQPGAPKGIGRSTTFLLRVAPTGELVDSFPTVPDADYIGTPDRNIVIPLGRRTAVLAHDSVLYVATGDTFAVDVYVRGRLTASHRRDGTRRPVLAAWIDALKAAQLADNPDDGSRARIERQYAEAPIPAHLPAYSRRMLVDSEGNLWVEHFPAPLDTERRWDVFGSDGGFVATVGVPAQFEVRQVVGNEVVGIWTNELDVESIRVYDLAR